MTISLDDTRSRPGSLVPSLYALAVLLDDARMYTFLQGQFCCATSSECLPRCIGPSADDDSLPEWAPQEDYDLEATVYFSFHGDDDNLVCFPFPARVPPSSYDDEDLCRR